MDISVSIIILMTIIVVWFLISLGDSNKVSESFSSNNTPITFRKCNSNPVKGIIKEIFQYNNINKQSDNNKHSLSWTLFYPCTYTHVENELQNKLQCSSPEQKIYAIDGCDKIVSKNSIWKLLTDSYGREKASEIMPESWQANDKTQLSHFLSNYNIKNFYICKKNIQRKKGLLLTNNLEAILKCQYSGYKIIQKYMKDVMLVKGHKINLRMYVLIVCDTYGAKRGYLYRDGKCMYTNKKYDKNTTNDEEQITSVNLNKELYESPMQLPLNFNQLQQLWNTQGIAFEDIFDEILNKLKYVMDATLPFVCFSEKFQNNLRFQLFGADIILDSNQNPYLLEFNKGPNMKPINNDDYILKKMVLEDVFRTVSILPPSNERQNGFRLIRSIPTPNNTIGNLHFLSQNH